MPARWCSSRRAEIARVLEAAEGDRAARGSHGPGDSRGHSDQPGDGRELRTHAQESNRHEQRRKCSTSVASSTLPRSVTRWTGWASPASAWESSRWIRRFRLTGRAFTILYGPAGNAAGHRRRLHRRRAAGWRSGARQRRPRECDGVGRYSDHGSRNRRGVAGTVIDGACRDTHLARELGYPILQPQLLHAHRQGSHSGGGDGRAGEHRRCARELRATFCAATRTAWSRFRRRTKTRF